MIVERLHKTAGKKAILAGFQFVCNR